MLQIISPTPFFADLEGKPLTNGMIYIGIAGQNPETSPVQVYWDAALTIPAAQPLRTINGYVVYRGTYARIYTAANDYSMTVRDKKLHLIFSLSDCTSIANLQTQLATSAGSGMVGWIQAGVGAVLRWAQDKLRERVSAEDFGAVAGTGFDQSAAIQRGIDYLASIGGGLLNIGPGTFDITFITRKTNVRIQGAGCQATILRALPSASLGMILIDRGPVQHCGLSDIALYGGNGVPANPSQWAVYTEAVAALAAPFDGGEWFSNWKNVLVYYFDNGIWFKGGDVGFLLPHQFNTFENCAAIRVGATLATGVSLKLTGQCGQFTDINGSYDGKTLGTSTNIFLGRNGVGTNTPYAINFVGVTAQTAERAFDIDNCRNINISGGHFEQLYRAVRVSAASDGVNLWGNGFANAGQDPVTAGTGYIIQVGAASTGSFEGNYVNGTYDKLVVNTSNYGFMSYGNVVAALNLPIAATSGISQQMNVTVGPPVSLDLHSHSDVYANTSASVITQINSNKFPGEYVSVRALGGPLHFATGGNISLGSQTTRDLPRNCSAMFIRADLINTWELVSVTDIAAGITTHGDANGILQAGGITTPTHVWNAPLTAVRSAFLDVTNFAINGSKFRCVRNAAAVGAFNLDVGGVKTLAAAGTWVDVEYDGTVWNVTASGSL